MPKIARASLRVLTSSFSNRRKSAKRTAGFRKEFPYLSGNGQNWAKNAGYQRKTQPKCLTKAVSRGSSSTLLHGRVSKIRPRLDTRNYLGYNYESGQWVPIGDARPASWPPFGGSQHPRRPRNFAPCFAHIGHKPRTVYHREAAAPMAAPNQEAKPFSSLP